MEKISFLTLRKQMPRVRERLKAGESFILTDRGKVIAVLQPVLISTEGTPEEHAQARKLAERFTATPADQPSQPSPEGRAIGMKSPQELRDEILRGVRTGKRE